MIAWTRLVPPGAPKGLKPQLVESAVKEPSKEETLVPPIDVTATPNANWKNCP